MSKNVTPIPVLIVGAGAAGLATSALLAQHGVRSLLVEKRREVFIYPKARNLSFRSLEILRALGLSDQVHAIARRESTVVARPTLNSTQEEPAIDLDAIFAGLETLSPEPVVQYCPQSRSEPLLLNETRRRGSEVRYGTELCSFDPDESGVTAVIRDQNTGESQTVRAEYLVGPDSMVIGIKWRAQPDSQHAGHRNLRLRGASHLRRLHLLSRTLAQVCRAAGRRRRGSG